MDDVLDAALVTSQGPGASPGTANLFRVCSLVIQSNIPLPELPGVPGQNPDLRFEVLPAREQVPGDIDWFHHCRFPNDRIWLSFARLKQEHLLRFPGQGDFWVSHNEKEVRCYPCPGTPAATLRHLLLDQVIPLLLSGNGYLVLHASAVLTDCGVIGFAGKTGCGKSTLATSFAQSGCPVVCDDYLVLRRADAGCWSVIPSYPGVRLWAETTKIMFNTPVETAEVAHYTVKRRISSPSLLPFFETPTPLTCLYFLDSEQNTIHEEASITVLDAREAFLKLLGLSFILNITDKSLLKAQFQAIDHLRAEIPCLSLDYPRRFSSLPVLHDAVANHLARTLNVTHIKRSRPDSG